MKLSLVLPCFNEEATIETVVEQALEWLGSGRVTGELIVVDDGSTDASGDILVRLAGREPAVRIVTHATNRGYGAAVRSGCDAAQLDWIAFMDSDGQFRASDLERLMPHAKDHEFVAGLRARRADSVTRRINTSLYSLLLRVTLGLRIRDPNCAMKLFRRTLWGKIRPEHATGGLFNAELFHRLSLHGIAWKQVPVPHYPRLGGRPTGARPSVILRTFRELVVLRRAEAKKGD